MPLDPFFADRLRTHRAYLVRSTLQGFAKSRGWPWLSRLAVKIAPPPATPRPQGSAAPSAAASEKSGVGTAVTQGQSPGSTQKEPAKKTAPAKPKKKPKKKPTRAAHRKAAIAWDAKELAAVGQAGPDVRIEEHTVAVAGRPDVRVRIYYPELVGDPQQDDPRSVPATLAFYGGGFRIGGIDYPTTDAGFRLRAVDAGIAVVAVDYALAPEHKFPTAVEQGVAALGWLADNAEGLGIDPARLAISGISAGGNIAASVALANRDGRNVPLRLQLLEVPVVDLTGRHIDFAPTRAMGVPTIFAIREMRSVARTYLRESADAKNPLASPLLAGSHAGLPPAHILTAEFDALRGEGAAYGAKIRDAGGEATVVRYLGMTHDTPVFLGAVPAARRWHRDVVTALRTLHGD
ncbi:alpha/beta hydrolase [Labedella endophytica]|uniref:alpha/beta hydrolase n=1 Tax=Labedella endophytica TaxID=1523160 RepID=UPI001FB63F9C|nr:alpha/beta hydrolase [Labedella endophytica]